MIKNKLLIISLVCFIGVNTSYFWDTLSGILFMVLSLVFFVTMPVLFILLCRQIYIVIRDKFADKQRVYSVISVAILLALMVYRPSGIIDFEKMEGKSVLSAWRGGTAGCRYYLKLTAGHKYYAKQVCFGIERFEGTYTVHNDTIRFKPSSLIRNNEYYDFGIIKNDAGQTGKYGNANLLLYQTAKDTLPSSFMQISQNELN